MRTKPPVPYRPGRRERAKGQRGEMAVRRLFERFGWTVRGLEGEGDHLTTRGNVLLHVECKDQAVLRLPTWIRQAEAEAPPGAVPIVVYKLAGKWRVDVPAEAFAEQFA